MQIGYMRVSSESHRRSTDLQRDALLAAGVDSRHLFEDHTSGRSTGARKSTKDSDSVQLA
jgi:DNA invertase Pin-like site-specific DNA recombinase